eukprot:12387739-Alexandrium_andersonii.AAC.1
MAMRDVAAINAMVAVVVLVVVDVLCSGAVCAMMLIVRAGLTVSTRGTQCWFWLWWLRQALPSGLHVRIILPPPLGIVDVMLIVLS